MQQLKGNVAVGGLLITVWLFSSCSKPKDVPMLPIPLTAAATRAAEGRSFEGTLGHYSRLFEDARDFLAERGPMRLAVNWNPQAPSQFQARYVFELFATKEGFVLFSTHPKTTFRSNSPLVDGSFAVWFHDEGLLFADRCTRSITRMAPFDPLSGASFIQMEVGRQLLGTQAVETFLTLLGKANSVEVDGLTTQKLYDELYNDRAYPGLQRVPRSAKSILEVDTSTQAPATKVRWLASGQPITDVIIEPLEKERLKDHEVRFDWVHEPTKAPAKASFAEVLRRLESDSGPIQLTGNAWNVGHEDTPFPISDVMSGARSPDICRIADTSGATKLLIGIGSAYHVISPTADLDVEDGLIIVTGTDATGNVGELIIGYLATDWAVRYTFPGSTPVEMVRAVKRRTIEMLISSPKENPRE